MRSEGANLFFQLPQHLLLVVPAAPFQSSTAADLSRAFVFPIKQVLEAKVLDQLLKLLLTELRPKPSQKIARSSYRKRHYPSQSSVGQEMLFIQGYKVLDLCKDCGG